MKTVKIGERTVEIYDAIDELPMLRFHKYNKMLLVDAGIGSDLQDFDTHIEKAIRYARSKTPELAAIELDNMRQNVYFIQTGISPKHLAFAVLVKSIDGEPYNSCIYLAAWADGKDILTVDGLTNPDGSLSPLQQAFVEEAAIQCGFCTPGLILSAQALINRGRDLTDEELRKQLAGHLCRCTGYENIFRAVRRALDESLKT